MKTALQTKVGWITPPGAIIDNAALVTASIDTKGFSHCDIYIGFGAMDIAMAALKVQQSDDDGSTDAYADIAGANFNGGILSDGTTAALPSATADNGIWAFHIDLKGLKRFLDLVATAGDGAAGTYVVAWYVLSNPSEIPNTAAERGLAKEIFIPAAA